MFRGRESAHQDLGFKVMNRVLKDMQEWASSERPPDLMGRCIIMLLSPRPAVKATGGKPAAPA